MSFNPFSKKSKPIINGPGPADNDYAYITDIIRPTPIQVSQTPITHKPVELKPVLETTPTPATHTRTPTPTTRTEQTKDTNTIRFHNDFIAKLKELKGPGVTFEQYLKGRLSL